jgi:hypothetical protein
MNAFARGREIEAAGNVILLPYLRERADGALVLTNKGTLAKWLQESVGDVLMNVEERLFAVELKCEQAFTGNLFLEVWSNRNLERRESHAERGQNPGWMFKSRADLLLTYFLDVDRLYSVDLFVLKQWFFGHGDSMGAIHRPHFAPKRTRSDQLNDTFGSCVPIELLCRELPARAIKQTSVRQREIEAAA